MAGEVGAGAGSGARYEMLSRGHWVISRFILVASRSVAITRCTLCMHFFVINFRVSIDSLAIIIATHILIEI